MLCHVHEQALPKPAPAWGTSRAAPEGARARDLLSCIDAHSVASSSISHQELSTVFSLKPFAAAALLTLAASAHAEPAVIFDMGGKFDKSFNQSGYDGAERWKKETGKPYLEFEISNPAQREQALQRMAERGASPIVGIGFSQASAVDKVAKAFPKVNFAIIDSVVALPNVQSIVFKEHEGSFLVGMMAALASKTGKVGFIGGMDIPLIRKFQCGFEQGAKFANPKAEVFANMTGTTPSAWNDPARGAELAKAQFAKGADVVFAAAGGTGIGVYQAAKDGGKLAIGVDSNQNHLQPGTMLTSMVKRVDVAVNSVFKAHTPGVTSLGLKEGGVDYAMDEHNAKLVSADMKKKVDAAKADIISGKVSVIDYMAKNDCK
jgi:basic membrane protein A and related proteins